MIFKRLINLKSISIKVWAWLSLISILVLTAFFISVLKELRFDYNFEKFFPDNDQQTHFYKQHRTRFESDNDFLLLAIENKAGVYNLDFLKKIDQLSQDIAQKVPYVTRVLSITNAKEVIVGWFAADDSDLVGRLIRRELTFEGWRCGCNGYAEQFARRLFGGRRHRGIHNERVRVFNFAWCGIWRLYRRCRRR